MEFVATKQKVLNRGVPPDSFLTELVVWGKGAPADIFAPNDNPADIYALIAPKLGPWQSPLHRRAAMLEAMRVHAGFESSWNWNEGVDLSAKNRSDPTTQETGAWQVSFDSTWIDNGAMMVFAVANGIGTVENFIEKMKTDHQLAMEYVARLYRVNIRWAGPIVRHEIDAWLSRSSVNEFIQLLS